VAQETSSQIVIFGSIPSIHNQQALDAVRSTEFKPVLFNDENSAIDELEYCRAIITAIRYNSVHLDVTGAKLLTEAGKLGVPRAILTPPELGWWVADKVQITGHDVSLPLGRRRPRLEQGIVAWLAKLSETRN